MSVSAGGASTPDVLIAAEGGDLFLARVRELAAVKASADQSLTDLALGRSARAAYDEAEARNAQALHELQEAQRRAALIIKDAQDKAAVVLAEAQEERTALMKGSEAEARLRLQSITDEIMATRNSVNEWALQTRAKCDREAAESEANWKAAHDERRRAQLVLIEAEQANDQAKKANDAAQAIRRDLDEKAERMRAALAAAS